MINIEQRLANWIVISIGAILLTVLGLRTVAYQRAMSRYNKDRQAYALAESDQEIARAKCDDEKSEALQYHTPQFTKAYNDLTVDCYKVSFSPIAKIEKPKFLTADLF